jgi:UDP-GlcNAc:undecaprenyl-phosphate/decaprenyl-phosphate GlcNAc-1-phosphate transferase
MIIVIALTSFLIALGVTALCTPIVRMLALRFGWVDAPDGERKLHRAPTPAIGGVAIAAGLAAALAYLVVIDAAAIGIVNLPVPAIWLGAALILVTGFVDDTRGIGFKGKFFVQVVVAYLLLHAGLRLDLSALPFLSGDIYGEALISIPITMLWIVGVINAVNLLDGLDGLAAGVSLIAFSALSLIFAINGQVGLALASLIISGALVGFLFYNFNPASIFMGDSGSLVLGYLLAALSLAGWGHAEPGIALLVPVVVLGLPLLDTFVAIVRRLRAGKAVFAPDRDHIHHRLARRLPQRLAVLTLYGAGAVFALAAILMSMLPPLHAGGVVLLTGVLSVAGVRQLGYHHSAPEPKTEMPAEPASLAAEVGGDGLASERTPSDAPQEPVLRVAPRRPRSPRAVPAHGSWD